MKILLQRVSKAQVRVDEEIVGKIGLGLVLLVGVTHEDTPENSKALAEKVANLRIFSDDEDKMNKSLLDVNGEALVVSQFTLYGDCKKGRRPAFVKAAPGDQANTLYEQFADDLRALGVHVETGQFQAKMDVTLTNDGPVTLMVEN